jgi:hypothetical protein
MKKASKKSGYLYPTGSNRRVFRLETKPHRFLGINEIPSGTGDLRYSLDTGVI